MQSIQKNRSDMIDVAKGIGILLVIYAHIDLNQPWLTIVYSFHMPLFFVLAGMVMNVGKYQTFRDILKDKFRKMILPYLLFCLLGILTVVVVKLFFFLTSHLVWEDAADFFLKAVYSVFWAPYSKKYFTSFNTPLWFVPCLMLIELMYYGICRLFRNRTVWIALSCLALTAAGWVMEAEFFPIDLSVLPFNFCSACFSIGFFAIGNLTAPYVKKLFSGDSSARTTAKYLGIAVLSMLIMLVTGLLNGKVSIGSRILRNGFLFYLSGLSGTLFILSLSKLLDYCRVIRYCGRNSFTMMGCHMIIYTLLPLPWFVFDKIFAAKDALRTPLLDSFLTALLALIFTVLYNFVLTKLKNRKSRKNVPTD